MKSLQWIHPMFHTLTKIQIWAENSKQTYFVIKISKISSNFVLISNKIDFTMWSPFIFGLKDCSDDANFQRLLTPPYKSPWFILWRVKVKFDNQFSANVTYNFPCNSDYFSEWYLRWCFTEWYLLHRVSFIYFIVYVECLYFWLRVSFFCLG